MAPKIYLGKTNEITEIIKIKSLWENSQGLFEKYESVLAFVCKKFRIPAQSDRKSDPFSYKRH